MSRSAGGFRIELRALRDQILSAIDGSILGDIEDGLDLYGRLVRRALYVSEELQDRSGLAAPGSWRNRWGREMEWLDEDIRTFVERAWRVANPDGINIVSEALIALLHTLRDGGQDEAHKQILDLCEIFFFHSVDSPDPTDRIERSRRGLLVGLRSYAQFRLLQRSQASSSATTPYLVQVLASMMRMTRIAIDHRPNAAEQVLVEIHQLIETMRMRDRRYGTNFDGVDHVETWAAGYLLGLAGYVLHHHDLGHLEDQAVRDLLTQINATMDEEPTWPGASAALDRMDDAYPWSAWETALWPPGKTGGTVGLIEDLIRQAAVARLAVRGEARRAPRTLDEVPPSEARYFIDRLVTSVEKGDRNRLIRVWPSLTPAAVDTTLEILREASGHFKAQDDVIRASLPLNPRKIVRFMRAVEREWLQQTPLRPSPGPIETEGDVPNELYGYNSITHRDYFTDSAVIADVTQFGEEISRSMIRGEVERSLRHLAGLPDIGEPTDPLPDRVRQALYEVRSRGFDPRVIVVNSWKAWSELAPNPELASGANTEFDGAALSLEYANRPVCLVADLAQALRIRRWIPRSAPGSTGRFRAGRRLMVNVIEIDAARAGTLYEENEHLRSSEYAQTQDEAILKLRACVQVTVWSKLDISLTNPHAGFALALPEGNDWV